MLCSLVSEVELYFDHGCRNVLLFILFSILVRKYFDLKANALC